MHSLKWLKMVFTVAVVSLCVAGLASAGDQDRKRDRKKDGSCQSSYILDEEAGSTLAALKTRDRKKDGSCQSTIEEEKAGFDLAGLRTRDRTKDRKKDGSCQSFIKGEEDGLNLAALKTRDRKKDGSCQNNEVLRLAA